MPLNHHPHDALERILGDMCGGARAAGDGRNEFPAVGFGAVDETGESDIDAAHYLQHVGTFSHRRPAAAMLEVRECRLGRGEGVGLVQEAADGDTCHQFKSSRLKVRALAFDVSLALAARAR
ncbi:hypothetical protein ACVMII_001134 [Bradyrhizobium diazoefficiens]